MTLRSHLSVIVEMQAAATLSSRRFVTAAIPYVVHSTIGLLNDSYALVFLSNNFSSKYAHIIMFLDGVPDLISLLILPNV